MNEGLADYTGVVLGSRTRGEEMSVNEISLHLAPQRSTFVRSFAHVTGPAYGYLLDQSGVSWRSRAKTGGDLTQMVAAAFNTQKQNVTQAEALRRSQAYDGDEIIARESERAERKAKVIADAQARLIDGPVLIFPLGPDVQYTFDPNDLMPLDDNTTLYPTTQVTDDWGVLHVENGALLIREKGHIVRAQVPAPAGAISLEGDGWKLSLKPGWELAKGKRSGDWIVIKTGS